MAESNDKPLTRAEKWNWPLVALIPNGFALSLATYLAGWNMPFALVLGILSASVGLTIGLFLRRSIVYPFASWCFAAMALCMVMLDASIPKRQPTVFDSVYQQLKQSQETPPVPQP